MTIEYPSPEMILAGEVSPRRCNRAVERTKAEIYAAQKKRGRNGYGAWQTYWLKRSADNGNDFAAYRLGKEYLSGKNTIKDAETAVSYLRQAANNRNAYAQYLLGKLYLMGEGIPKDKEAAQYWFSVAEQNGHEYAGYFLDRMERQEEVPPPNILLSATRLLYHMGNIFRDHAPTPAATGVQIDRKRLQRLWEKKMAMGHK